MFNRNKVEDGLRFVADELELVKDARNKEVLGYFNTNLKLHIIDLYTGQTLSYHKGKVYADIVLVPTTANISAVVVRVAGREDDVIGSYYINTGKFEWFFDKLNIIGSGRNSKEDTKKGRVVYKAVTLYIDGGYVTIQTHQIVATAKFGFEAVQDTLGRFGLVIDHIDGDKTNNSIENIDIVTRSENTRRYYASLSLA